LKKYFEIFVTNDFIVYSGGHCFNRKNVAKFEDCKKDRTIINTNSFFVLFINYNVLYCYLYVNKDTGNEIFYLIE